MKTEHEFDRAVLDGKTDFRTLYFRDEEAKNLLRSKTKQMIEKRDLTGLAKILPAYAEWLLDDKDSSIDKMLMDDPQLMRILDVALVEVLKKTNRFHGMTGSRFKRNLIEKKPYLVTEGLLSACYAEFAVLYAKGTEINGDEADSKSVLESFFRMLQEEYLKQSKQEKLTDKSSIAIAVARYETTEDKSNKVESDIKPETIIARCDMNVLNRLVGISRFNGFDMDPLQQIIAAIKDFIDWAVDDGVRKEIVENIKKELGENTKTREDAGVNRHGR